MSNLLIIVYLNYLGKLNVYVCARVYTHATRARTYTQRARTLISFLCMK